MKKSLALLLATPSFLLASSTNDTVKIVFIGDSITNSHVAGTYSEAVQANFDNSGNLAPVFDAPGTDTGGFRGYTLQLASTSSKFEYDATITPAELKFIASNQATWNVKLIGNRVGTQVSSSPIPSSISCTNSNSVLCKTQNYDYIGAEGATTFDVLCALNKSASIQPSFYYTDSQSHIINPDPNFGYWDTTNYQPTLASAPSCTDLTGAQFNNYLNAPTSTGNTNGLFPAPNQGWLASEIGTSPSVFVISLGTNDLSALTQNYSIRSTCIEGMQDSSACANFVDTIVARVKAIISQINTSMGSIPHAFVITSVPERSFWPDGSGTHTSSIDGVTGYAYYATAYYAKKLANLYGESNVNKANDIFFVDQSNILVPYAQLAKPAGSTKTLNSCADFSKTYGATSDLITYNLSSNYAAVHPAIADYALMASNLLNGSSYENPLMYELQNAQKQSRIPTLTAERVYYNAWGYCNPNAALEQVTTTAKGSICNLAEFGSQGINYCYTPQNSNHSSGLIGALDYITS